MSTTHKKNNISSSTLSSKKKKPVTKKKRATKKQKLIVMNDSISSLTMTPELKEKNEQLNPGKIGQQQKDLKISQDINLNMKPTSSTIVLPNGRLNEQFIDIMEKLAEIMLKQGEPFRARAYQKAQETIMAYQGDILSPDDLKGRPAIGPTIMEKLNEYVSTGTLKVLEREKTNPVNILAEVYGIGPKKAKELVEKGISSIDNLRKNQQMLNDVQRVGLKYYEDILKRITRSEIDQYESIFASDFSKVATPNSRFEIVGSYRRGALNSGDIDVIITSDNPQVFINFIDELIKKKIILEVLSRGPTKCLVITKIPSSDSARRVDFLYTSLQEFPFAILYFTGSKIFNTVMRHIALEKGYTMNEHGLYIMKDKKKGEKVSHHFKSEEDIFNFLGLVYKAPNERIDGRAIIIKGVEPEPIVQPPTKLIKEELEGPETFMMPLKKTKKTLKKKEETQKEKPKKKLIIQNDFSSDSEDEFYSKYKVDKNIKKIVEEFKKNGISFLDQLNEEQLSSILREATKAYFNEQPIMTDNQYDIVKEYIEQKYPTNQVISQIGAPVERNKVTLPYFMASMDKIKADTNSLSTWSSKYKGPYVLSCKLDGVSGLYTTEGSVPKLYTRGDGKVGQDISHFIPYLRLPKRKDLVIRGEFIIPKAIFDTKYKSKFANGRNMVAGIVNHKSINTEVVKDLHFVAYELIKPIQKPSSQLSLLSKLDIEVVLWRSEINLTNELLSSLLVDWRENYAYEIDGVIVTNDSIYDRKLGNPHHAFAFKMVLSDQIAEAKVVDVIWTPSKDGYLKPRVQIEPINLGGVCIEYATGFNGAFINDNKIGIGSLIEIIRSGDVIPHIRKVIFPAEEAKMPLIPYKWNDTHVDIMLENLDSDETVREKNITGFFRGIGVEGLSSGNIARIVEAGFDSVPKILNMTTEDFLKVEGFKEKTATKLYNGIREKIDSASLVQIMSASNLFGRGFSEKRLELIMESYPNVLLSNESVEQKVAKVASIKGMAKKTAEAFVERIPNFIQFMEECSLLDKLSENYAIKKLVDTTHPLFGKIIVMTGFRDQNIQDALKLVGAKLGTSVSKQTFLVLVKDIDTEDTGKVLEAKKLGIPLMTPEQFRINFGL
jgi:NAD-dependent DNA ligase